MIAVEKPMAQRGTHNDHVAFGALGFLAGFKLSQCYGFDLIAVLVEPIPESTARSPLTGEITANAKKTAAWLLARLPDVARFSIATQADGIDGEDHADGQSMPFACAANLRCSSREGGMPILRQLCTVLTGAPIMRATAVVPPSGSKMGWLSFSMLATMRLSQIDCKGYFQKRAIIPILQSARFALFAFDAHSKVGKIA